MCLFPGDQLSCIIELLGMPPQKLLDQSKRAKNFISSKGTNIIPLKRYKYHSQQKNITIAPIRYANFVHEKWTYHSHQREQILFFWKCTSVVPVRISISISFQKIWKIYVSKEIYDFRLPPVLYGDHPPRWLHCSQWGQVHNQNILLLISLQIYSKYCQYSKYVKYYK